MARTFPRTDDALLAWSANLSAHVSAGFAALGVTPAQAAAYAATHATYAAALAACDPAVRTRPATAAKNAARSTLKAAAVQLISIVNGQAAVTESQKIPLGITGRAPRTPAPAPARAPGLTVGAVRAWTVTVQLHDPAAGGRRGKPPGVSGASLFSFVGPTPPADLASWRFETNTGRTRLDVTFPSAVAPGTKVWLAAFWFNGRKQGGPAGAPVATHLQGGGVSMAA